MAEVHHENNSRMVKVMNVGCVWMAADDIYIYGSSCVVIWTNYPEIKNKLYFQKTVCKLSNLLIYKLEKK